MDVEIEPPHHHHHRPTGFRWLDLALPVSALVVSVVSIVIALHHGEVMQSLVHQNERLVQANSLPHVELDGSNGGQKVSLHAINRGVGPAEFRSVRIFVDGRPIPDITALMNACCETGRFRISTSTLLGKMVQAGQVIDYVSVPFTPETKLMAERFDKAWQSQRITTEICYCSVFDECWTVSSKPFTRPVATPSCPMPEPQYRT